MSDDEAEVHAQCTEGDIEVRGDKVYRCKGGTWIEFEPDHGVIASEEAE